MTQDEHRAALHRRLDVVFDDLLERGSALLGMVDDPGDAEAPTCPWCGMEHVGEDAVWTLVPDDDPENVSARNATCVACGLPFVVSARLFMQVSYHCRPPWRAHAVRRRSDGATFLAEPLGRGEPVRMTPWDFSPEIKRRPGVVREISREQLLEDFRRVPS